jgi:hypothetical protein
MLNPLSSNVSNNIFRIAKSESKEEYNQQIDDNLKKQIKYKNEEHTNKKDENINKKDENINKKDENINKKDENDDVSSFCLCCCCSYFLCLNIMDCL